MKLYLFPPSTRVLGIVALKNHLALDFEVQPIDLGSGDQLTSEYLALNPKKCQRSRTRVSCFGVQRNSVLHGSQRNYAARRLTRSTCGLARFASSCANKRNSSRRPVPRRHARPICRAGPSDCSGRVTSEVPISRPA